ncbi:hypothetical protein A0U91_14810 (plasmid) [Acetobacter persici]|uniref:Uncharacterized protein n=2 Tax=Acetobacter persici TaxID=1076596 RepID=A0A1U9LIJ9_9PROT|nr:hypothetical protein A0U91_14810 [Acetobacter persici]
MCAMIIRELALVLSLCFLPAQAFAMSQEHLHTQPAGMAAVGASDRVMIIRVNPNGSHQEKADALLNGAARFMLIAEEENVGAREAKPDDLIKIGHAGLGTIQQCDKAVLGRKNSLALGTKIGMVPSSMEGEVDIKTNAYAAQRVACPYQDVLDLKAKVWSSADGSELFMSPVSLEIYGGRDRRYRL